MTAADPSV